ncbi:sodium-dependent transporter [Haliea sp.]|jgi:NSS family neurotransmitter:Na+ symporter|uniref:sodium-dependent transporter n=1 Tax=Haliea TaxID=475794 RepID=UPI000C3D3985|nr:sodium-dependent transporter [Haliea sp.]HBM83414.1 sodium-dependent transporter [Halieaceae bacterium]MAY92871.1 sodium-dependent transporter [Haliea sp.]MBK40358.1 sodium-dependent transporter [Haliea sp.]MBP68925.1 sodium-dependent transporter [Haliea sp.]HCD56389.1 sodium-dependent transporter [Halieaceae bacterium]
MAVAAADHWSSRFAFLMAAVGFAVGLGNIWRFPYITGENGGAAFVIVYLLCAFCIGMPILIAELMVGRRGQASPPEAMAVVATESGRSRQWQWVGGMGLLAAYTIEIVYAVIVGWVLWYLFKAVTTGFADVDAVNAAAQFTAVQGDTLGMLFWTLVGLGITGLIIYAGVKDGIERAVVVMMPLMFLLLLGLAAYNYFAGGFHAAIEWLFTPDFSKIGPDAVLAAIGQAFFSIGVAMGGMMIYGSYLPRSISIGQSALIIVVADTVVALLAGLVIFPAVFNYGLDPAAGAGLIFQTLPVAFAQMPGGHVFSVLFFTMLSVAGITSMVGLVECVNAWIEERYGMPRHRSALLVIASVAVFSVLSILSYNVWVDFNLGGRNFNDTMDYFSNQILLPLGGLMIAVFAGWITTARASRDELWSMSGTSYGLWRFMIRFVVPPALVVIFVRGVAG